jgi:hypothetical protein
MVPTRGVAGSTWRSPPRAGSQALPHAAGWRELPCAPDSAAGPTRFRAGDAVATVREMAAGATPPAVAQGARRARRRWFGVWLTRPRRVLLVLAAVWVISIFDFGFTLLERDNPLFVELNPLAAALLTGPTHLITAFKFGLLGLGTAILVGLRRRAPAELACWFLLAAKVYVALRWYAYYDCLMSG